MSSLTVDFFFFFVTSGCESLLSAMLDDAWIGHGRSGMDVKAFYVFTMAVL